MRARDTRERWCPGLTHDVHEFAVEDIEHALYPALPKCRESPDLRTTDPYAGSAEGEGLEDVGAAPDAAIQKNRRASAHRISDLRQAFQRGAQRFFIASAVVGNNDAIDAVFDRQCRVFTGDNPFDQ